MDMSLPVIDGWEATRRIKANDATRRIPVIALTRYAACSSASAASSMRSSKPGRARPAVVAIVSTSSPGTVPVAVPASVRPYPDTIRVTASFPSTVGLYPGDDVRVVGVPMGTISEITPRGGHVEVVMELDPETPVAADTGATDHRVVTDVVEQLEPEEWQLRDVAEELKRLDFRNPATYGAVPWMPPPPFNALCVASASMIIVRRSAGMPEKSKPMAAMASTVTSAAMARTATPIVTAMAALRRPNGTLRVVYARTIANAPPKTADPPTSFGSSGIGPAQRGRL